LAAWRLTFISKPLIFNLRAQPNCHITTLTQAFIDTRQLVTFCRFFSNLWRREALNLNSIMNIQVVGKLGVWQTRWGPCNNAARTHQI
jgi:hypothetical protein